MNQRQLSAHRPNRTRRAPLAWVAAGVASLVLVAGCASAADAPGAAPQGAPAAAAAAGSEADAILAKLGLSGRSATDVITALDQASDRQKDIFASVRYDKLVLKDGGTETQVALPADKFYLSVAPYVNQTHECFYHSLTTCTGELANQNVDVKIVDSTGKTLVEGTQKTYANGFVGFWLPRDIEGTITVTSEGRSATSAISTGKESATCLATLQLT
ncbi:CueP family metal-binding protein [Intrasporangium sp. DVR]|uniref:CueP family metal-binding protein n=1 Tax=Intrasporangium sp. DVR TaxID=3127867 RepID=UPI00313A5904